MPSKGTWTCLLTGWSVKLDNITRTFFEFIALHITNSPRLPKQNQLSAIQIDVLFFKSPIDLANFENVYGHCVIFG